MVHDRAAFGGTLLGLGVLCTWLTVFPLSRGEQWAWWAWLVSGTVGFATFLTYLGYGYLDSWHGIGTLLMLPVFVAGMVRSRRLAGPLDPRTLLCLAVPRPGNDIHARHDLRRVAPRTRTPTAAPCRLGVPVDADVDRQLAVLAVRLPSRPTG